MSLSSRLSKHFSIYPGDLTGSGTIGGIAAKVLNRAPTQRLTVVGWSFGGAVAMDMMRQLPERIDKVILINADHLPETPDIRATRRRQMSDVKAGRLRDIITKELIPSYEFPASKNGAAIAELVHDMAIERGADVFLSQSLALMTKRDYSKTLEAWQKPVLILCGENDALVPPHRCKSMASLMRSSKFHIIKRAGHFLPLEKPEQVNELIARFLEI